MFQRKVTVVLILLATGLILGVGTFVYPRAFQENLEGVRRMVKGIAATGAMMIDGDLHQTIPPDSSALTQPAYGELQARLRQILAANLGVRYAWTMVKSETPGETLFVGDVGGARSQPGLRYNAKEIPDLWLGFEGPAADRRPVKDPWGISISGYAPIRNSAQEVVALLGVDVYDEQLQRFRRDFQTFLGLSLLLGIGLSILMGSLTGRWIGRPVKDLIQGMRRLEAGGLGHEINLKTQDEFEEVASAFNRMSKAIGAAEERLKEGFLNAIRSLMSALEAKDPYTRGHSESVTRYAVKIAQVLGKSEREIEMLGRLAMLHDIGKIGIQDAVLQKPDRFTPEERQVIQRHPEIGKKILSPLGLAPEELALIFEHHEREDGTGYPQGLDRTEVSDLVSIVSVADAYDAMISHRPHRPAMRPKEALEELYRCSGTQFRPEAVEALHLVLQREGSL